MKKILFGLVLINAILLNVNSQNNGDIKKSTDDLQLNQNDIVAALNVAGIQIFKFNTGVFDKKLEFILHLEKYSKDSLISSKILYKGENWYNVLNDSLHQRTEKYINTMRIITKDNENNCDLSIYLHGTTLNRNFEFTKTYNRQFYVWKKYSETKWKLNEQIPVLAYISSWKDKRGYIRNCGVRELSKGEDATNKIFNTSPDYFILSYSVREINN